MVKYPDSLDPLPNPGSLASGMSFAHETQHADGNDILRAIEAKLGIGASVPGATGAVLRRTAAGASAWGPIVSADIDTAASIALSKLAPGSAGLLRSDGSAITAGNQLIAGDVPASLITRAMLAADAATRVQAATSGGGGYATTTTSTWVYTGANNVISGLTVGCPVLLLATGTMYHSAANAVMYEGIGIDSTAAPSFTLLMSSPVVAAPYTPFTLASVFTSSATSHALYELVYNATGGTLNRLAGYQILTIEFKG